LLVDRPAATNLRYRAGRSFEAGDLASLAPGIVLAAALVRDPFGQNNPVE
jgi:hypothetical protein